MITALPMNAERAAQLTERIKTSVEELWELIAEAHDRKAWKALGYESWKGYVTKEFAMSEQHSYRLLNQGQVIKALSDATNTRVSPDLSHREVGRIKPRLQEVTDAVEAKVADGMDPKEAIREVVDKLDEPITEPIVINGSAYVSTDTVAAAVAAETENNPLIPFHDAIASIHLAQYKGDVAALVDRMDGTILDGMLADLPGCIDYLNKVLTAARARNGLKEVSHG